MELSNNDYYDLILRRKQELAELIAEKQRALEGVPESVIHTIRKGNSMQFYIKDRPGGKEKYISKKHSRLIRQLLQKKYDKKVLKAAMLEYRAIERFQRAFPQPEMIRQVYSDMDPLLKELVIPADLGDKDYILNWQNQETSLEKLSFGNSQTEFYTDRNERVRSKSEVLIANQLNRYGIPYQYETPLRLRNGIIVHPDFKILNVKSRKTKYLEHLGMMDDPEYAGMALQKITEYEESGIFLGRDLILTYETARNPLKTKTIERIIRTYLL